MAPVYAELKKSQRIRPIFLSTGQHRQMLRQALAAFSIEPDHDLDLMQPRQELATFTSAALDGVARWIAKEKPAAILVQGDTTTVLSAALAGFYAHVPIGHVEAGLRTGNMQSPWPEEMNRRVTSILARWHFCPTTTSRDNLLKEGIEPASCHVTGNPVIDALLWMRQRLRTLEVSGEEIGERIKAPAEFTRRFLANPDSSWVLVTGHRRESFGGGFDAICAGINLLTQAYPDLGVLYPVHLNPRVLEPVSQALSRNPQVALVAPAAYEDFVWLMDRAKLILTDSGGVQEEAPALGKPVLVMRETTERPEGVAAGTCRLVGTDPEKIIREARILLDDAGEYARRSVLGNPYGDGQAATRIRTILEREL